MTNKGKIIIGSVALFIILAIAFFASLPPGIDGNVTHFTLGVFLYNSAKVFIMSCFIFSLVFLYFLPSICASRRCHNNMATITLLNFLLGWTLLGWLIAFIWSLTNNIAPTS